MRRLATLLLTLLCTCFFAEDGVDEGSVKVAYELEVNPDVLGPLVPYFDLEGSAAGREFLARTGAQYLRIPAPELNAQTAKAIAPSVLSQLSQNLALDNLSAPLSNARPSILIGVNGAPLPPRTGLDELQSRWNKWWSTASIEERSRAVPVRSLAPRTQAEVLFQSLQGRNYIGPQLPALRTDAELSEVLAPFNWHRDQAEMEFKDQEPSEDVDATLKRWKRLASLANVSAAFNDPRNNSVGAGYHLNISVHGRYERDLELFTRLYQLRLTIRRIDAGDADKALSTESRTGYTSYISLRGAARLKTPHFFEVRAHTDDAETEVKELVELLKLPPGQAERKLADQIQQSLTLTNMREMATRRRGVLADAVSLSRDHATPGQVHFDYNSEAVQRLFRLKNATPHQVAEAIELFFKVHEGEPQLAQLLAGELISEVNQNSIKEFYKTHDADDTAEFLTQLAALSGNASHLGEWRQNLGDLVLAEFIARPTVAGFDYLLYQPDPKTTQGLLEYLASSDGRILFGDSRFTWDYLTDRIGELLATPALNDNPVLRKNLIDNIAEINTYQTFDTVRTLLKVGTFLTPQEQDVLGVRIAALADGVPRVQGLLIRQHLEGKLPPGLDQSVKQSMPSWDKAVKVLFADFFGDKARTAALARALGTPQPADCPFDDLSNRPGPNRETERPHSDGRAIPRLDPTP